MGASNKKSTQEDANLETFSLIWLDSSHNNSEGNLKAQQRLRTSINHLKIFDDNNKCEEYIRSAASEDRLFLIVNHRSARQLVPRIEELRQICSIYIYSTDKKTNHQWTTQFIKVKGVFDHLDKLVTRFQSDHVRQQENTIDDSFPVIIYNANELNTSFIYSHLLFDSLLQMNTNDENEFISLCKHEYKDNATELTIIDEFERKYTSNRALLWYTRKAFIYRILNKALQTQNIDLLFMLRFFIQDIYHQIEQCKCSDSIRVYRSHLMTYEEIQLFKNSLGQFISINSFLSTSLDRGLALFYLYESDDLERVLFEIDADPRLNKANVFGNIKSNSFFQEEEQILFTLGSIFRLISISLSDDGIWIIQMKLCTEDDVLLKPIFGILTNDYHYGKETNVFSLGQFLLKQDQLNQAEKFYRRLLNEFSSQSEYLIKCYNTLGKIADMKGNYELSIQWFNKSIKIKTGSDWNIVDDYNNIGEIYRKQRDYKRAIESYNNALIIFIKTFGEEHPKLAMCFNNIAIAYKKEKKYNDALEYHKKALVILIKYRPKDHSDLAVSYNNIGVIHRHLTHYDQALEYYNQALKIYEKTLSFSYFNVAKTYRNMGKVYENKGELRQSLLCLKKAATLYRHTLSELHPDVMEIEEEIQYLSSHIH